MPAEKETEVPETGGASVPKIRRTREGTSDQEALDNAEVAGRVPRAKTRAPEIARMTERAVRERTGGKTAPAVPGGGRGTLPRRRGGRGNAARVPTAPGGRTGIEAPPGLLKGVRFVAGRRARQGDARRGGKTAPAVPRGERGTLPRRRRGRGSAARVPTALGG